MKNWIVIVLLIETGHILRAINLERMGDTNKDQKFKLMSMDVFLYVRRVLFIRP